MLFPTVLRSTLAFPQQETPSQKQANKHPQAWRKTTRKRNQLKGKIRTSTKAIAQRKREEKEVTTGHSLLRAISGLAPLACNKRTTALRPLATFNAVSP
jgi:hypothetical protein